MMTTQELMKRIEEDISQSDMDILSTELFSLHYKKALAEMKSKGKVLVFGAGDHGRWLINDIESYNIADIVAVSDNNDKLWGTLYLGYPVVSPQEIAKIKEDCIIAITPGMFRNEIFRQLIGGGIDPEKLMVVDVENRWRRE